MRGLVYRHTTQNRKYQISPKVISSFQPGSSGVRASFDGHPAEISHVLGTLWRTPAGMGRAAGAA